MDHRKEMFSYVEDRETRFNMGQIRILEGGSRDYGRGYEGLARQTFYWKDCHSPIQESP